MTTTDKYLSLHYLDSDGAKREVKGCNLTLDKVGRYDGLLCDMLTYSYTERV